MTLILLLLILDAWGTSAAAAATVDYKQSVVDSAEPFKLRLKIVSIHVYMIEENHAIFIDIDDDLKELKQARVMSNYESFGGQVVNLKETDNCALFKEGDFWSKISTKGFIAWVPTCVLQIDEEYTQLDRFEQGSLLIGHLFSIESI